MNYMWTAFMVVILVVLFLFLLKFLFYNCVLLRPGDDSIPIITGRREAFWMEYDRLRRQALWARQPPPDFEDALRNSRPVSYLDVEEEPPPTYDDFLKSCSPSPASTLATLSPISQGVDFYPVEESAIEDNGGNFVLNPFENDFVIDLHGSRQDLDAAALVDGVFRNHGATPKCNNDSNQSEA